MSTKRKRKDVWLTYYTSGYTHDVANDQASAGGVHHYEVRRHRGQWQRRILQSNGRHHAYGSVEDIDDEKGEECFAMA